MKAHWHEQIQRCMTGDATPEEIAALQQALKDDAELRALYLDYMNLDMALGTAAEAATIAENGIGRTVELLLVPPSSCVRSRYELLGWGSFAAAAACAVLVLIGMLVATLRPSRPRPDVATAINSTQSHIARLSIEPPTVGTMWASPTDSLLDEPRIPQ
jgi:hypothetical protein